MKRIGWVGYSNNRPFFELTADDYTQIGSASMPDLNANISIPTTIIFRSKREALKRFMDVRPVYVENSTK